MEPVRIGVIGGSGVYEIESLEDVQEIWLDTPFGQPSDAFIVGTLAGQQVAFLSRHSRGHRINPTRLNRSQGVASMMVTHSLDDLRALPSPHDVAKAKGFIDRSAIVVLSGLPRRELREVSDVVALTDAECDLVCGWASGDSWHPGRRHPGRGKYLIKAGRRPGLPVQMELTPEEVPLYDTAPRGQSRTATDRAGEYR